MSTDASSIVGAIGALALVLVEYYLTQTKMIGSHLHIFIFLYVFQSLFKRENHRGNDLGLVVGTGSTHIGEFLRFCDVDHNIIVLGVLPYYLTGIHLILREYEEAAAVLKFINGIGVGRACLHRYQRAVGATLYLTLPWLIFKEAMRHDGFTGSGCKHIVAKTDDATRRDMEFNVDAVVLSVHADDVATAARHHIDDFRTVFLRDIYGEGLDRLALYAIDFLDDDLRLAYLTHIPHGAWSR